MIQDEKTKMSDLNKQFGKAQERIQLQEKALYGFDGMEEDY